MELKIERAKVLEFLQLEFRIKQFLEAEMGKPLEMSVSEAAKEGLLIDFMNSHYSEKKITYNKDPKEIYAKMDNISILNKIMTEYFGIHLPIHWFYVMYCRHP